MILLSLLVTSSCIIVTMSSPMVFVVSTKSTSPISRHDQTDKCIYHEGDWSECDNKYKIQFREDLLHLSKISTSSCPVTRVLHRQCPQQKDKCVFEKSKDVPWTGCLDAGVTQKVLHLVDDGGIIGCPKQKLISRKCRLRKRRKHRRNNVRGKKRMRSTQKF